MRIAIIGATGVAGRILLPLLRQRGHAPRAGVRSAAAVQALAREGVEATVCDILDPASLVPLLAGCDAVVNLATAIPKAGGDWTANDRVRAAGTHHLLAACAQAAVPRLVQQSVAMLHCADDSRPQAEDDALEGYGVLASAAELERSVAESALDWRIVRGGLFYGADSGRERAWAADVENTDFRIPGDGTAWFSLVHVRDFAHALALVAEHPEPRQAYIACDDAPLTVNNLYSEVARRRGRPLPPTGGPSRMRSFRTSNAKLRGIGWLPEYPALERGWGRAA
jgi:nucleoside-diphosphate-sugar epimerase